MDDRMRFAVEMHEVALSRAFERTLADLEEGEVEWRPLPESNNIALIVRHLSIEARWHLDCLERGMAMPFHPSPELQREIDAVPIDFAANLAELTRLTAGVIMAPRRAAHLGRYAGAMFAEVSEST